MDPQTVLEQARATANKISSLIDNDPADDIDDMQRARLIEITLLADTLAENMRSLDLWITRGGFLPKDWNILREGRM